MNTQTPGRFRPGVFVCLLLLAGFHPPYLRADAFAHCTPTGKLESAELKQVVDGDTLLLRDGRSVRLIGINTPELGRDGRANQLLAETARRMAADWLAGETVLLEVGAEPKDRYGRYLASVFRGSDRQLLSEYLLNQGLGWQVTVPPNSHYSGCLQVAEQAARQAKRGVWAGQRYPLLKAATLVSTDTGFQRVQGRVTAVSNSRRALWIELEQGLSLRLGHDDQSYFAARNFQAWLGKQLTVRGWLIYRGKQQRGYPPHIMHLRHPAMLDAVEE